jgi:hypothetical protein
MQSHAKTLPMAEGQEEATSDSSKGFLPDPAPTSHPSFLSFSNSCLSAVFCQSNIFFF